MSVYGRARAMVARRGTATRAAEPAPEPERPGALATAVRTLAGAKVACVVDVGTHTGESALDLLAAFPDALVHAFEPDTTNHATAAERLAPHAARATLHRAALSDQDGTATLHVNTHDGTHSLLDIGAQRYWGAWAGPVGEVAVPTVTLDGFCAEAEIARIDLLKMDIQGSELAALRGARGLLENQAIGAILLEVMFQPLYRDQPLVWDIGGFLAGHGYALAPPGLLEPFVHEHNSRVLAWAEALFLAPCFLDVPEWQKPG